MPGNNLLLSQQRTNTVLPGLVARGIPAAQFELATRYDLGNCVPAGVHVAFAWFRRAAGAGLPEAEFNVAVMLDSGRGAAQNIADAALWYARSAAHGNHRAQFNLGLLYAAGELPCNPDLAAFGLRPVSRWHPARLPRCDPRAMSAPVPSQRQRSPFRPAA